MSVGFFVYILVFSKKKYSAKSNAARKMVQRKSTPVLNEPTCFLVRVVGVEQLNLMCYRQKRAINSRKSEGITQLCWLMPNSFFDI